MLHRGVVRAVGPVGFASPTSHAACAARAARGRLAQGKLARRVRSVISHVAARCPPRYQPLKGAPRQRPRQRPPALFPAAGPSHLLYMRKRFCRRRPAFAIPSLVCARETPRRVLARSRH